MKKKKITQRLSLNFLRTLHISADIIPRRKKNKRYEMRQKDIRHGIITSIRWNGDKAKMQITEMKNEN